MVEYIHDISQSFAMKSRLVTDLGIELQNQQAMYYSVLDK